MPILQFQTKGGNKITINARPESTVVMRDRDTTFTFDYEGRLIGAFREGRTYRRSLANEVLEKQSGPQPGLSGRLRRQLPASEVKTLETDVYAFTRALASELRVGVGRVDARTLETVRAALARASGYCYTSLERERLIYQQIYHPVTILPPDQYLTLYLQATVGCSFNRCTFCNFYHDRRFRIKRVEEFREHIRRVRAFLGGGLSLRCSIFLGDANALCMPQAALVERFDAINAEFAILPGGLPLDTQRAWQAAHPIHFDGIYSFVDAFTTRRKRTHEFQDLAARGLRRVYVGLETGDPKLLRFLGKPNSPGDLIQLVNHAKAGGVAVGVIILVGAGGDRFQEAHIRETTRVVNDMPLDENDLIYLSELVDFPNSAYSARAQQAGIRPLRFGEIQHQLARLRAGFSFGDPRHAPRVSYYDIREFVY